MENQIQDMRLDIIGFIYQPHHILLNIGLAFILGLAISAIYRGTHKGLSYSQSFMLTLVFVTVIVSIVMMVIGNNLARAFALVGALSIIRFRTVVKDTKDTSYVFMSLAAGMAAGTSSYFLAVASTIIFLIIAYILHLTNYGLLHGSDFILKFRAVNSDKEPEYSKVIAASARSHSLLHVQPSGDAKSTMLTFDINLKRGITPEEFSSKIGSLEGVSETMLIASKADIDF